MRFNASFLELALGYGLSAYVFGEVCVFGCTWHNLPAGVIAFAGMIYSGARAMECVAAWLTAKWRQGRGEVPVHRAGFAALAAEQAEAPLSHALPQRRIAFPPRRVTGNVERPVFRHADAA